MQRWLKDIRGAMGRDLAGKFFLVSWAGAVSVIITLLMAGHLAPFAAPAASTSLVAFTHKLNQTSDGWQILHVVADKCRCSNDVVNHLIERGRSADVTHEAVTLVGHRPDLKLALEAKGFHYTELSAESITALTGVEAAPTMAIVDERGDIRYIGGYYQRRERAEARDLAILADVMKGKKVDSLPTFGCAFSKRLQRAADPIGLKYPLKSDNSNNN